MRTSRRSSRLADQWKWRGKYGSIASVQRYLHERDGAAAIRVVAAKTLRVPSYAMTVFGGKNDCVPVAITRVIEFYGCQGVPGCSVPTADGSATVSDVRRLSAGELAEWRTVLYHDTVKEARRRGYTRYFGTSPLFIAGIAERVARARGFDAQARSVYAWSFDRTVVREIDAGRPLLLNLARGSYARHTVTVVGYRVLSYTSEADGRTVDQTARFLAVIDSWHPGVRFIDYNALAYDFAGAGIGSFTLLRVRGGECSDV